MLETFRPRGRFWYTSSERLVLTDAEVLSTATAVATTSMVSETAPTSSWTWIVLLLLIRTSTFCILADLKPSFSTLTVYAPGINDENENAPCASVVELALPVGPEIVTDAPTTTAFEASTTVPPQSASHAAFALRE